MKRCFQLFGLFIFIALTYAHAATIELEFNGQKQIVEFDPNNPKDLDRVERLWMKADHRNQKAFYVYSETGGFQVCEEPRNDSKCKLFGGWYQELSTSSVTSPYFVGTVWDKTKWHPRGHLPGYGWLKLDDPNLIWPSQLKPVKEWPIRYIAYYGGEDTVAAEEGIKPKYDPYERRQFDREGYLLNNRTMKRKISPSGNFLRVFQHRDFIKVEAVSRNDLEHSVDNDGHPLSFNLKQYLNSPKLEYDKHSDYISIWATFGDPVKPIYDKHNNNACVIDCKNRRRWAP